MGRASWLLRIGMFSCYFAGGLAIWVDSKFSLEWIKVTTNSERVMPGLGVILAFIIAVIASSFGAILTAPYSWQFLFIQSQKIAGVKSINERGLYALGYVLLSAFLISVAVTTYAVDILSTYDATKNYATAICIVLASDACFLLANVLGMMSKASWKIQGSQSYTTVDTTAKYKG